MAVGRALVEHRTIATLAAHLREAGQAPPSDALQRLRDAAPAERPSRAEVYVAAEVADALGCAASDLHGADLAARAPRVVNAVMGSRLGGRVAKWSAGMDQRRQLPPFAAAKSRGRDG